jgi:hypothetical protein
MRASEQLAFDKLKTLTAPDLRLVDSWHELGNDWVTLLVNSGVLGQTHRTHPSDIQADTFLPRARRPCVARASGGRCARLQVHEIVIGDHGSGRVENEIASRKDTAVMVVAGGLWITTFRSTRDPEGDAGCGRDHRALAAAADQFGARRAVARPTRICANAGPPCWR